ncbi:MAG: hypothetical protein ABIA78_03710 [archaeon]
MSLTDEFELTGEETLDLSSREINRLAREGSIKVASDLYFDKKRREEYSLDAIPEVDDGNY